MIRKMRGITYFGALLFIVFAFLMTHLLIAVFS